VGRAEAYALAPANKIFGAILVSQTEADINVNVLPEMCRPECACGQLVLLRWLWPRGEEVLLGFGGEILNKLPLGRSHR
jgi:hypothetical protein